MIIVYPNLNILNIRCDGKNNTIDKCSCIYFVVSSQKDGWVKWLENNVRDIIGISNVYSHVHQSWETWNKTSKVRFSVKVDSKLSFF